MDTIFNEIYQKLSELSEIGNRPALLAIDGRCGSGKSTLAAQLANDWSASLFHMDDFFLQPYQRTPERRIEPGGNVDRERFLDEVLMPLRAGKNVIYRRFNCKSLSFDPDLIIEPQPIAIIEGSYACHPDLRDLYDLRIFLDIDPQTQQSRIEKRSGLDSLERFKSTWIPMEETYFFECRVPECCDYILSGNKIFNSEEYTTFFE